MVHIWHKDTIEEIKRNLLSWTRKGYTFTLVTQIAVMVSGILTIKLASYYFGPHGYGVYAVTKRAMSILGFSMLMGLGISIPRYIGGAYSSGEGNSYLIAGILSVTPIVAIYIIVSIFWRDFVSSVFFGDTKYDYMVFPLMLAVIGLILQTIAFSYYRGYLRMWVANIFQIVTAAVVPLCSVAFGKNPYRTFLFMGGSWIVISSAVLFYICKEIGLGEWKKKDVIRSVFELLSYGTPRVLGEFAWFGLFSIPTFLVAHHSGIKQAGFFSFGLTVLQLLGSVFVVTGIVLLPYISKLRMQEKWEQISKIVAIVVIVSLSLTLAGILVIWLFLPMVINLWMGQEFLATVSSVRWMLIAGIPYVLYIVLRSPMDAISKLPFNAVNTAITLFVIVALIEWAWLIISPTQAMIVGLYVLGGLTVMSWYYLLHQKGVGLSYRLLRYH